MRETLPSTGTRSTPTFTLGLYAKATKRRERLSGAYLAAYDRALEWATLGQSEGIEAPHPAQADSPDHAETAR